MTATTTTPSNSSAWHSDTAVSSSMKSIPPMTPDEVEEKLRELADLPEGWDDGLWCAKDENGKHVSLLSPATDPKVIEIIRQILATAPAPTFIAPISGDRSWIQIEWEGAQAYFEVEVCSDGPRGWLLYFGRRGESGRKFYEMNTDIDIDTVVRFAHTTMKDN